MGSVKVTSGAYQLSTIGLKNDVYSLARTRFSFVTVAANSSLLLLVVVTDADGVASVVDMKSSLVRVEEGGQNASEEARRSSSELTSVSAVFVMVKGWIMKEVYCSSGTLSTFTPSSSSFLFQKLC